MARNQQQLESQVRVLSHLLQQHSIPVPDFAGLPHDSVIASPQFLKQNVVEQHHPEWPQASTLPSPLNSLSPHSNADSTLSSQISFFDQTVVGMQFILKFVSLCPIHDLILLTPLKDRGALSWPRTRRRIATRGPIQPCSHRHVPNTVRNIAAATPPIIASASSGRSCGCLESSPPARSGRLQG